MKYLLSTIIIVIVLFIRCTTDENSSSTFNKELTINLVLEKVKSESINNEKPVEFNISIDENNNILLGNALIIPASRFKEDFSKRFNNNNLSFKELLKRAENKLSSVYYSINGEDISYITCEKAGNTCIRDAVQAYLTDDDCSTVCLKRIRYVPSLRTFYISKNNI